MMMKNIRKYIFAIAAAVLTFSNASGQEANDQAANNGETPKPTKYVEVTEQKEHLVFFQGFTLSADLYGVGAYLVSDYGWAEGALRLNLKNTYFPIIEVGYGKVKKLDDNTQIEYKAQAPYARIGFDMNMLKNKFQDNRLYVGFRYGMSKFKYDMSGPAMTDPIWGGSAAFNIKDIDCTSQWGEFVFGAEVRIWRNFHMGWSVRYKMEFSSTKSDYAKPSCIPGYGYTTTSSNWGGTYNLIFDLNWGKKKSHKRGVNVEIRDISDSPVEQTENKESEGSEESEVEEITE